MIEPTIMEQVVDYLEMNIQPILGVDVSTYAPGRKRLWLEDDAPLSLSRPWAKGHQDERLWNWIVTVLEPYKFKPMFGLVSKGGVIHKHRDASTLNYRAFAINLGKVTWCYAPNEESPLRYNMVGGEVFSFNSKIPHWTEEVDENRWAFNFWTVSNKDANRYYLYKESEKN
jgi:hypothetical protein